MCDAALSKAIVASRVTSRRGSDGQVTDDIERVTARAQGAQTEFTCGLRVHGQCCLSGGTRACFQCALGARQGRRYAGRRGGRARATASAAASGEAKK